MHASHSGQLPLHLCGDAAAYFDPNEPEALRHALEELLGDSARRERMAARGRRWASRFSWERTARETAAVYRELL